MYASEYKGVYIMGDSENVAYMGHSFWYILGLHYYFPSVGEDIKIACSI